MPDYSRIAAALQGMRGTQSGPADESQLMEGERLLQWLASTGAGLGSGLGMFAAGPTPLGALGAAGVGTAAVAMNNAYEPNIRDVWLDQARMQHQAKNMRQR